MYHTSDDEIESIAIKEGFREKAYRPGPGSNLTIGYGQEHALFPETPGEIPVTEDLVIDEKTAKEALYFFVYNVVDPLVTEHFNPQNQDEHDACASFVYNIRQDKLRRNEYTLPKLVCRADRSPEAIQEIIDQWLVYCLTPGFESGLFRRRLIEVLKFLGLPWDAPSVLGLIRTVRVANRGRGEHLAGAAYIHPTGKLEANVDPDYIIDMAEAVYDAMTPDEQTAALNDAQLEALGGKPSEPVPKATPKANKVKVVEAPKLKPDAPPKPMEQSTTAKGMAQQKAGADQVIVGTVTTTMAGVATAREVTKGIKEVNATAEDVKGILFGITIEQLAMLGLLVGGVWLAVGLIRWQSGRIRKAVGRAEAEVAKI
jgi:GH24 family phage-related lysozyme (muramidase)